MNYVKSLNQSQTATSGSQYDIEIPSSVKASVFMDPTEETSSSSSNSEESGLLGNTPASCHVTVCDINQSMLEVGKSRAAEAGITSGDIFYIFQISYFKSKKGPFSLFMSGNM